MRYRLRTLLVLLAVIPPILALFSAWNQLSYSNCGGNSAALSDAEGFIQFVQYAASESPNGEFSITKATPQQAQQLAEIARDVWIGDAGFLVSPRPYRLDSLEPRRIIFICDRPFTNVPRCVFGRAPPTHAAAFSDGTTGLVTAKQFSELDRSSFVPLSEILTDP